MKLIFVTNFLTPHQLPMAEYFYKQYGKDYCLIETQKPDDSIPIGWKQEGEFDFVVSFEKLCENRDFYTDLITNCDVVILGGSPNYLIKNRLKKGKLTFKYSERIHKKKRIWYEVPLRLLKYYFKYGRYKNFYLLCASAFASRDFAESGAFVNKAFKWGYFPKTKNYDIDSLVNEKQDNTILWVARFIDWKHPEVALEIAKRLRKDGYKFTLNMIGTGDLEEETLLKIEQLGLNDNVNLLGSMPPEDVRKHMEKSQIFLMTSDRKEGWGAVLNEAMNSACAVVANSATGSAPYLVKNGENGFLYNENNIDDMYKKVKYLLDNKEFSKKISLNAYTTIKKYWNAEEAAKRFIGLANNLLLGIDSKNLFDSGVCSKADQLKDNWYQPKDGEL